MAFIETLKDTQDIINEKVGTPVSPNPTKTKF